MNLVLFVPAPAVVTGEIAAILRANEALQAVAIAQHAQAIAAGNLYESGRAFHQLALTFWEIDTNEKRIKKLLDIPAYS